MALGILETDKSLGPPPGTFLLEEITTSDSDDANHIKLVLVPEPSYSSADPLNWSRWRKKLTYATILVGAIGAGVVGPILVPAFGIIVGVFNITLTQVSLLNGSLVMAQGVSSYLCTVLSVTYGRRLLFLVCAVLQVASSAWGGAAKSYSSLLAARVFQGLGMGSLYALASTVCVNDLFFVHERGRRVGLWNLAVISTVNITPAISAHVIVGLSWQWSFYFLAILFGIHLVMVIFFFPETAYNRSLIVSVSPKSDDQVVKSSTEKNEPPANVVPEYSDIRSDEKPSARRSLWRQILGMGDFKFGNQSRLLVDTWTPILLLRSPSILWFSIMWSICFSWVIIQASVSSQIFGAAPYNMTPIQVGNLVGIAPLIGSVIGTLFGGWLCDFLGQFMAKRNNGIFEPEFRLLAMIPFAITMAASSFGLGLAIEAELSAIICGVFLAILNFSVGLGCTCIISYSNDSVREMAGQAFGVAMFCKSVYAFGLTFMLNDYYTNKGPRIFYFTWGGLSLGFSLLAIPLYIYGKRIRMWSANVGIF